MKAKGKVAKRYARALFELCSLQDFDSVLKTLTEIAALVDGNKELSTALDNPAISLKDRNAIAADIVKLCGGNSIIESFLSRALENNRLAALTEIAHVFAQFIDAYKKVKSLEITSASPIGDEERGSILSQIRKDF